MMQSAKGALKPLAGPALIESRAPAGGLYGRLGEVPKLLEGVASEVLPAVSLEASVDGGATGTFRYGGLQLTPSRWSTVVATPWVARRLTLLALYTACVASSTFLQRLGRRGLLDSLRAAFQVLDEIETTAESQLEIVTLLFGNESLRAGHAEPARLKPGPRPPARRDEPEELRELATARGREATPTHSACRRLSKAAAGGGRPSVVAWRWCAGGRQGAGVGFSAAAVAARLPRRASASADRVPGSAV